MIDNIKDVIKTSILELEPYKSARGIYNEGDMILMDANENPFDFKYARYPDPYQKKLKNKIGEIRGITSDKIFLGNGSDEIIDLLIRITCEPNDKILCLDPSYGMYKVSATINNIECDLVSLDTDLSIKESELWSKMTDEKYKLIFVCTPNNPDGKTVSPKLIQKIVELSNGLVVVDEAYIDFSEAESWVQKIEEYENLIVLQTFSKSWAGAGLRVGIGFANPWLINILNKVKPPYNISSPAQYLALEALENIGDIKESIVKIISERTRMQSELIELDIVEKVFESEANFLLVRFVDSNMVREKLMSNGILVRDRSFQSNCASTLRISIGTSFENDKLLSVIKNI